MATSFVNDLNALANSLSGAAQSVAGLYQTRVQLETMRLQSELQAKDDEFISRLYLPDDDPNKITIDNWETALNNHKADQENLLGDQRWKRVAGAVRTNLAPEVSGFNEKFAKAMYTQERKYIQSETMGNVELASKRGDIDSVNKLMDAGIDSRLFDDPGAARIAQAKFVTEATVNKIGMELASGAQDSEQLEAGRVLPVEGTAYERAVKYINANADDPDAKVTLLANESAKAKAATEAFKANIKAQITDSIKNGRTVPIGQVSAMIDGAKDGGYVDQNEIIAAENEIDAYKKQVKMDGVSSAVGAFIGRFHEMAVPEAEETRMLNELGAKLDDPAYDGLQKDIRTEMENVRQYSKESREGKTPEELQFSTELSDLWTIANAQSSDTPRSSLRMMAMNLQKKMRPLAMSGAVSQNLYNSVGQLIVDIDNRTTKGEDETGKLLTNENITSIMYNGMEALGQSKTPFGKLIRDGLANSKDPKAKATYNATMTRFEQALKNHAAIHGSKPEELEKFAREYGIRLAEVSGAIDALPGTVMKEGWITSIESKAAKYTMAANKDQTTDVGDVYREQAAASEAVANQLVRLNSEEIKTAFGVDGAMVSRDKADRDKFVIKGGGKTLTVSPNAKGDGFIVADDKGKAINLMTAKQLKRIKDKGAAQKAYEEGLEADRLRVLEELERESKLRSQGKVNG